MTAAPPVAVTRPARPYPGLRPFQEEEWSIFFGREQMIDEVIGRLAESRLVLIHGVSGSGKSSLVRAGVLPKLALQYRRHDAPWLTCAMRPCGGPLWNLAAEFARLEGRDGDGERISAIAGQFNARSATLASVAASLEGFSGQSLCLLVDQFEELFRYEKDVSRDEAELFVDLVGRAATGEANEAAPDGVDPHVIVTMRSEFLGECARFAGFAETINRTQYLVPRMDDDGLMRAVRRPAQMYGAEFGEGLAERLIASVRGREDELPLLQHGLMLMWEDAARRARPGERVSLDGAIVDEAGGLDELLSGHADKVMASAAPYTGRERIVEAVFRALTDVNSEGSAIRRPLPFHELCAVADATPDELRPILDAFRAPGVSFLRPYAPTPIVEKTPIDISHEALIRCWRRISAKEGGWLQQEFRDGLAWRLYLFEAGNFARDRSNTLSKAMTEAGERRLNWVNEAWSKRYDDGWAKVKALVDGSREHWEREAEKEGARRQAEIETEQLRREAAEQSELAARKSALLEKERARRSRLVAIVASIGALITLALAAYWNQDRLKEEIYLLANVRALTTAQEHALKAGEEFRECADCPEMIVAPAGRFTMGSPEGQGNRSERPQHEVTIAAFRRREICADVRRMGRLRRPRRLQAACRRKRLGARSAARDQSELGRCANLCEMALQDHWQGLSAALRGRVRICGARRNSNGLSMGGRDQAERRGDGQLRRLRQPMGRQADRAGRVVRRESIRPLRYGRQRLGVDGGLLARQLRRSAGRRFALDERRL